MKTDDKTDKTDDKDKDNGVFVDDKGNRWEFHRCPYCARGTIDIFNGRYGSCDWCGGN